jgi:hypothetical protein
MDWIAPDYVDPFAFPRCRECVGMSFCAQCGTRLDRAKMRRRRTIRRRARRARRAVSRSTA